MLQWSQVRLLRTVALGYLLFAEVSSWLYTDAATCVVNPAKYSDYYAQNIQCPTLHVFLIKLLASALGKLDDPNNVTMLATIAIATFTFTLWRSTQKMMAATRDAVEIANKEFIATHRPRIVVRSIQGPIDDSLEPRFVWVTIVNCGETATRIVAMGSDLARRKGRNGWLPPGVFAGAKSVDPITLQSGERMIFKAQAQQRTDDQMIADAVWDDEVGIETCAVGEIKYLDANGRLLEMSFLRVHDGEGNFIPSKNPEDEYQD